jgi:RNA polymerase sigma-70 factor (ECF subfamily)
MAATPLWAQVSTVDDLAQQMARLADGDRWAFAPLYAALKPRVHALCRAMLRHEQDAEDAMQQVMEKLFARASSYEHGRPVVPWALGIAAWECRAYRQKRKRRREDALVDGSSEPLAGDELNEEIARADLQRLALQALQALSDTDREVLTATFWDEATLAGVTGATLRKRRERALDRLRTTFGRLYGFD